MFFSAKTVQYRYIRQDKTHPECTVFPQICIACLPAPVCPVCHADNPLTGSNANTPNLTAYNNAHRITADTPPPLCWYAVQLHRRGWVHYPFAGYIIAIRIHKRFYRLYRAYSGILTGGYMQAGESVPAKKKHHNPPPIWRAYFDVPVLKTGKRHFIKYLFYGTFSVCSSLK